MAEYFKAYPLPWLDALGELSDDAALVYCKALLMIYHRNGSVPAEAVRNRFPRWRGKRIVKALDELIASGKLVGTAAGHLHNERALHELSELEQLSRTRAASGEKGGRSKAQRDRLARQIASRNLSPDLFPKAPPNGVETQLNGGSTAVEHELSSTLGDFNSENPPPQSNDFNDIDMASLQHARAPYLDLDQDEEYSPVVPSRDEGETNDDFAIPKRKPGKPIPADWTADHRNLSDAVRAMVADWPQGEFEREAQKFVEDAHSEDRRHREWDRAFGKWLTKHDQYLEQRRTRHDRPSGWTVPKLGGGRA